MRRLHALRESREPTPRAAEGSPDALDRITGPAAVAVHYCNGPAADRLDYASESRLAGPCAGVLRISHQSREQCLGHDSMRRRSAAEWERLRGLLFSQLWLLRVCMRAIPRCASADLPRTSRGDGSMRSRSTCRQAGIGRAPSSPPVTTSDRLTFLATE